MLYDQAMEEAIKVLLIDDQEEVRDMLCLRLSVESGLSIVGAASSGYEGIIMAERTGADVILTDLRMPGLDGIKTTQEIFRRCSEKRPKIIVMTAFDDDEYVLEAIEAGASGYLLKDTKIEDLANAIRLVHSGSQQFAEKLEQRVLGRLRAYSDRVDGSEARFMTERDSKITQLLSHGKSDTEIAEHLNIGPVELKQHLDNLKNRLGLKDRQALVLWSMRQTLG